MPFTYQMVDTDIQQLFEAIDNARRSSWEALQNASKTNDQLAEQHLRDVKNRLVTANTLLGDLNRKISMMKEESAKKATS